MEIVFSIHNRYIFQQCLKFFVVVNMLFRDEFFECVLFMCFQVSLTLVRGLLYYLLGFEDLKLL